MGLAKAAAWRVMSLKHFLNSAFIGIVVAVFVLALGVVRWAKMLLLCGGTQ